MDSKMTQTERFEVPDEEAPPAELWAALDRMNAIKFTGELFADAVDVMAATRSDVASLERFCEAQGLLPADVAAAAILIRYQPVYEAMDNGIDFSPGAERYAPYAAAPIEPEEIGLCLWQEEGPDDHFTRLRNLAVLGGVKLTIDQIERGYHTYVGGCSDPFDSQFEMKRLGALLAFCVEEELLSANLAAEAILARYGPIDSARAIGIDLKTNDPERYKRCASGPISPAASDLATIAEYEDVLELFSELQ